MRTRLGRASQHGMSVEEKLNVFRGEETLINPVTGGTLGKQRRRIAQVEITEVREKYSKVRQTGDLEIGLAVGDQVEPARFRNSIVIAPPCDSAGRNTKAGIRFAEELTVALVKSGIPVVENNLLLDALSERAINQSALFDPAKAANVGKYVGAHSVLTGTLFEKGRGAGANLRLVEVETGKILDAVTCSVREMPGLDAPVTLTSPTRSKVTVNVNVTVKHALEHVPPALEGVRWISKNASYTVSSKYENIRPLPSLLNESNATYCAVKGVSRAKISEEGYNAFTTNKEPGAHVTIDLGNVFTVRGFYIRNRKETQAGIDRAKGLTIWLSPDRPARGKEVWSAEEAEVEWYVALPRAIEACYVVVGFPQSKSEHLHLSKIMVFGNE